MPNCYLGEMAYAVGQNSYSVEESSSLGRTISGVDLLRDAGFSRHHICSEKQTAYDLAAAAVAGIRQHLAETGAIIYATCLPQNANLGDPTSYRQTRDVKHLMDFPASHLQSDFGLDAAQVYGLTQQACTGMLGSIHLATALLNMDNSLKSVLCVTADRFPPDAIYEQSYNLISDGSAACLVSRDRGELQIIAHHGVTNGALALASDDETVGSFFNYSHAVITAALKKANLTIKDIDWIVPQNTNRTAWQILSSLLGFDFKRVHFPSLDEFGHLISGDNIINLKALNASGALKEGQRVLLFMAGYGLNWQCLILQKVGHRG